MSTHKKVTFIVPVFKDSRELEASFESIINQAWPQIEVICIIAKCLIEPSRLNRIRLSENLTFRSVEFSHSNIPKTLNEALLLSSGEVIFFVLPFVSLLPGFLEHYIHKLYSDKSIGFIHGNFIEVTFTKKEILRETLTDEFDYSEATQIGPVRGYKREVFELIGMYGENLRYSYDYDLRLRISERFKISHLEKPLYKVLHTDSHKELNDELKPLYSFIPWDEDSYQSSYLLYNQEKESEFSEACFRSLRRRQAFISRPFSPLICPHQALKSPSISVVTPLFNRAHFIGKAIESVLHGTFKDFEIIIVDNGSSDASVKVVREYLREKIVRLYHNDRNNIARALNLGIRLAKGKYIAQLDSDDLYTPRTLEVLYSFMEANSHCALGVSYYDYIGPCDEVLENFGVVKHLEFNRNNLIRTDGIGAARIWHRCVLEELGGFDEHTLGDYAEDYDLELKVSENYETLRIPHVLFHRRKHFENSEQLIDFKTRHFKKTFARKAAILRRQSINKQGI